eukprot:COSAG01_NODE_4213_length_5235_cov_2.565031_2_plen_82_part_00
MQMQAHQQNDEAHSYGSLHTLVFFVDFPVLFASLVFSRDSKTPSMSRARTRIGGDANAMYLHTCAVSPRLCALAQIVRTVA